MTAVNWIAASEAARVAASACINGLRREHRGAHFTHREVEIVACDGDDDIGTPIAYLTVKELSGKKLAELVNLHAPAQYQFISIEGGCDGYTSLQAMLDGEEPDIGVKWWDVDTREHSGEVAA